LLEIWAKRIEQFGSEMLEIEKQVEKQLTSFYLNIISLHLAFFT
jgi:hypothetical protein